MKKKLNLGCGFDKREGFINADNFPECEPDVRVDIESVPWPFEDNQFDHVLMKHVLEHVGAEFSVFRDVMRELYRVLAPSGIIEIHVPDYRHNTFWSDPTHVRAFTLKTFEMMSKKRNDEWISQRANYTMLSYVLGVDFELVSALQVYDAEWLDRHRKGEITRDELRASADKFLGVVREIQVTLRAIK
jgi:SAM-dependent methyltransferase